MLHSVTWEIKQKIELGCALAVIRGSAAPLRAVRAMASASALAMPLDGTLCHAHTSRSGHSSAYIGYSQSIGDVAGKQTEPRVGSQALGMARGDCDRA